jgi:prepilin-type N-terminal cleavage/methylation domain-containing protein
VKGGGGFTLLELIIVISILSIMALIIAPRIPRMLGTRRGDFAVFSGYLAAAFDDAFLKNRDNYLVIHLSRPDAELSGYDEAVFSRTNGISVLNRGGREPFVETANRLLRHHAFPDSFRLEEVVFSNNETVREGNVFIPFYSSGRADDAVVHILVNGRDRWSVRIFKLRKEAKIIPGYMGFERP